MVNDNKNDIDFGVIKRFFTVLSAVAHEGNTGNGSFLSSSGFASILPCLEVVLGPLLAYNAAFTG